MQCIPIINPIIPNVTGAVHKLRLAKSGGVGETYRDKM